MNEQEVNEELHRMSLRLARLWHIGNSNGAWRGGDQHDALLEAYINVRRAITKGEDGKRFGARAAYKAMQGEQ